MTLKAGVLILDGGFDVAKLVIDGFCFCWLPDSKWVKRIKQRFGGRLLIYGGLLPWWWNGERERESTKFLTLTMNGTTQQVAMNSTT